MPRFDSQFFPYILVAVKDDYLFLLDLRSKRKFSLGEKEMYGHCYGNAIVQREMKRGGMEVVVRGGRGLTKIQLKEELLVLLTALYREQE